MDDLDHSMHISNHDWLSFFEESEECCLRQASLALPDSPGLSDGDDQDFPAPTCTAEERQVTDESKKPQEAEERALAYMCPAEESKVEHELVGTDLKSKPELHVTKGFPRCAEKGGWGVTVNDDPPKNWEHVSGTVGKKKRKHKKIWKNKNMDGKDHINTDMALHVKVHEKLFSDTNDASCGREENKTHSFVGNIRTKQTDNEKSGICAEVCQHTSPASETIIEFSDESHSSELNMDLARLGNSFGDSTLDFTAENESEPTEIKCDTGTKYSDSTFIQGCESSKTNVTMDLFCLGDLRVEANKSINHNCLELGGKNEELNMDLVCLQDSRKDSFQVSSKDNSNNGTDTDSIRKSCSEIDRDVNKHEDLWYFEASCKQGMDLVCDQNTESIVPTDNQVSHTNSVESDDFAEVEVFSNFSLDSETYHSAAESVDETLRHSQQNSPYDLPLSIDYDCVADTTTHSGFQGHSSWPHIETSQTVPSTHPVVDNKPNDISTWSDGTNSTAPGMSVNTCTSAGNSPSSLECQPEALLEPKITMESPEAFAKATGDIQPVYAISAFWDEMEKLTINDILQIRMGRCMLPVEEELGTNEMASSSCDIKSPASSTPEVSVTDTVDAADSDYCTNLDESKPDRSSCEFSTSDFEEEYWQFINSSQNSSPDLHDKSHQNPCSDCIHGLSADGEDSDEIETPVPFVDCSGQKWSQCSFSTCDGAVPHQMRKTKSLYDVRALRETMDDLSSQTFVHHSSFNTLDESLSMSDTLKAVTPIMCHTDEQYTAYPKIFENLLESNKARCETLSVSEYGLYKTPALSINNYTLCKMNNLPIKGLCEEPIPIFSCSRSIVRELTFSKPGCIFLGLHHTAMKDISPIQILTQPFMPSRDCGQSDGAFCVSKDLSHLYLVKNIYSLDQATNVWRNQFDEEDNPADAFSASITVVREGEVFSTTPQMFKDAALRQISMENNRTQSDYQGILSTLKQSDLCLVCIAFASWVLRSSDPEAADAWKAALLANVSALSAIQYLRQFMKKKASPKDD